MKIRVAVSTEYRYPGLSTEKGKIKIFEIDVPPALAAEIIQARENLPNYVEMEHRLTTVNLIDDNGNIIYQDEQVKPRH